MAIAADLARRRSTLSLRSNTTLVLAGAIVVEAGVGLAIAAGHPELALAAAAAAVACVLIVRFPFATACVALFTAAGVLTEEIPPLRLGVTAYPHELLTGALLALAIVRPRRRGWGGAPGLALALFLGVLLLSSIVAWQRQNGPLTEILLAGRGYFMLTFFWIVVRLFPGREGAMRVLGVAAIVGGVTGFVSLLLGVGLDPGALLLSPNSNGLRPEGALNRVRLPGLALAFATLPFVLLLVTRGHPPRWLWRACLLGAVGGVLVSFNRNMWVAGTVGVVLLAVLMGPSVRGRIVAAIGVLLASVALFVALPATSEPATTMLRPLIERGTSLLDPSRVEAEESLRDRDRENAVAWSTAKDNLLLGVAPGTPWGLYYRTFVDGRFVSEPQSFVHNQYLYLLLITGVPGLLLLVAFAVGSAAPAFAGAREHPYAAMAGIGLVTIMLTAIVMLSLSDGNYLLGVALLAAAIPGLREAEGGDT